MKKLTDIPTILNDIDLVLEFHQKGELSPSSVAQLIPQIRTWNLLHGIYILRKIMAIPNLELNMNFATAVILHDIVKYKGQPEILKAIYNHCLGEGMYGCIFPDHGMGAGYLMMHLLHPDPDDISFLYFHTKDHPFHLDPTKIPSRDLAFYLIDDLIKGIKRYRFSMVWENYSVLEKFMNRPRISEMNNVFRVLSQYKLKSKKE